MSWHILFHCSGGYIYGFYTNPKIRRSSSTPSYTMASLPQDDIEVGTRSGRSSDSPTGRLRRRQSEPLQAPSGSDSEIRSPVKCIWCGEEFPFSGPDTGSNLRNHMRDMHPDAAKDPVNKITTEQTAPLESDQESNLLQPPAGQETLSTEDIIASRWKMNNVQNFSADYEGDVTGLVSMWEAIFDGFERPQAYESATAPPGKFLPMTDPNIYVDILKDPNSHSNDELYAITSNAAQALKVWQDEYHYLDKLIKRATRSTSKKAANPRDPEDAQVYEDKKEAMLYGYKYDPRPTQVGYQDPFAQGGFIPTTDQMRKFKASGLEPWKADRWEPVLVDGVECVPKIRPPAPIKPKKKPVSNAARADADGRLPAGPKRITRFGGSKHPLTREASQAQTEPSTPAGSRAPSRQGSLTPQRGAATPMRKSGRTSGQVPGALGLIKLNTALPKSSRPSTPKSPAPASATTSQGSTPFYPDPLLDPKNQLKIQQSKHPKRTEAMILHWAKFNKEGRTRNPKRTKAQIEAAKVDADREPSLGPRGVLDKKRKHDIQGVGPTTKRVKEEAKTEPVTPVSEQALSNPFLSIPPNH